MKNVTIISHPLIDHNLARLRDEKTEPEEFRRALGEVAMLMVYEATRGFDQKAVTVRTPITSTRAKVLKRRCCWCPSYVRAWECWSPCCGFCLTLGSDSSA